MRRRDRIGRNAAVAVHRVCPKTVKVILAFVCPLAWYICGAGAGYISISYKGDIRSKCPIKWIFIHGCRRAANDIDYIIAVFKIDIVVAIKVNNGIITLLIFRVCKITSNAAIVINKGVPVLKCSRKIQNLFCGVFGRCAATTKVNHYQRIIAEIYGGSRSIVNFDCLVGAAAFNIFRNEYVACAAAAGSSRGRRRASTSTAQRPAPGRGCAKLISLSYVPKLFPSCLIKFSRDLYQTFLRRDITLALIAATRGVVSKMPIEPATLCNISIHMKSVLMSWRKGMS